MGRRSTAPLEKLRRKTWFSAVKMHLKANSAAKVAIALGYIRSCKVKDRTPYETSIVEKFKLWQRGTHPPNSHTLLKIHDIIEDKYGPEIRTQVAEAWFAGPDCSYMRDLSLWSAFQFPGVIDYPEKIISCKINRKLLPRSLNFKPVEPDNNTTLVIRHLAKTTAYYMAMVEEMALIIRMLWIRDRINGIYQIAGPAPLSNINAHNLKQAWEGLNANASDSSDVLAKYDIIPNAFLDTVYAQAIHLTLLHYPGLSTSHFLSWLNYLHTNNYSECNLESFERISFLDSGDKTVLQ